MVGLIINSNFQMHEIWIERLDEARCLNRNVIVLWQLLLNNSV